MLRAQLCCRGRAAAVPAAEAAAARRSRPGWPLTCGREHHAVGEQHAAAAGAVPDGQEDAHHVGEALGAGGAATNDQRLGPLQLRGIAAGRRRDAEGRIVQHGVQLSPLVTALGWQGCVEQERGSSSSSSWARSQRRGGLAAPHANLLLTASRLLNVSPPMS